MVARKMEKITALIVAAIVIGLSCRDTWNWENVGIYAGCSLTGRLLYPFFHANFLHALLNAWCLLSVVFIYDISILRLIAVYLVTVTMPVETFGKWIETMNMPTVGLSGIVFALFGSISFEVLRGRYYQSWMCFYLLSGFLFPCTNAWMHLYCYLCGLAVAFINKPIKVNGNGYIHHS